MQSPCWGGEPQIISKCRLETDLQGSELLGRFFLEQLFEHITWAFEGLLSPEISISDLVSRSIPAHKLCVSELSEGIK